MLEDVGLCRGFVAFLEILASDWRQHHQLQGAALLLLGLFVEEYSSL